MSLKSQPISSIRPFEHIDCPVCGCTEFTELGTGGGVWCDRCNASFSVRMTSGDAGCVVDCKIDHVYGGHRIAMKAKGYYRNTRFDHEEPGVYLYKIMKEPDGQGGSGDCRSWYLASLSYDTVDPATGRPYWQAWKGPLISEVDAKLAQVWAKVNNEAEMAVYLTHYKQPA